MLTFGRFGPKVSRDGGGKPSVDSFLAKGCIPFCFSFDLKPFFGGDEDENA